MTVVQNRGHAQEVLYSGFAGRLYGCSWLITSGTSNLAKSGYLERQSQAMRNGLSGLFAESKFLSLTVPERLNQFGLNSILSRRYR